MSGHGSQQPQALLLPSALSPPPTSSSTITSQRPRSSVSAQSAAAAASPALDGAAILPNSQSLSHSHSRSVSSEPSKSSRARTLASSRGSNAAAESRDRNRAVRTLPSWVQTADDEDIVDPTSLLLPRTPTNIRPASHNHTPTPKASAIPGRKFDHAREGTPVTIMSPFSDHASKWQQFTQASDYDFVKPPSSRGQVVDDDWMKEHLPDLETPWKPMDKDDEEDRHGYWLFNGRRRRRAFSRFHKNLMNHPMVPLVVRLMVFTFSALALGLAGSIFHKSDHAGCRNGSSTWMAILVDVVAIVYTTYITYDEYTSKPLGLRSHNAKMRLIFLDLLFIVFDSANLSLAFQALTDPRWSCRDSDNPFYSACPFDRDICVRQKALTATLLIALFAWLSTFAISTLRLVEKVAR